MFRLWNEKVPDEMQKNYGRKERIKSNFYN